MTMDPNKALEDILSGLRSMDAGPDADLSDREDVCDQLEDLAAWLRNGGFPPTMECGE